MPFSSLSSLVVPCTISLFVCLGSPESLQLATLGVPAAVVEEKMVNDELFYKIRWKGFKPDSDTWEAATIIDDVEEFAHIREAWRASNDSVIKRYISRRSRFPAVY